MVDRVEEADDIPLYDVAAVELKPRSTFVETVARSTGRLCSLLTTLVNMVFVSVVRPTTLVTAPSASVLLLWANRSVVRKAED